MVYSMSTNIDKPAIHHCLNFFLRHKVRTTSKTRDNILCCLYLISLENRQNICIEIPMTIVKRKENWFLWQWHFSIKNIPKLFCRHKRISCVNKCFYLDFKYIWLNI